MARKNQDNVPDWVKRVRAYEGPEEDESRADELLERFRRKYPDMIIKKRSYLYWKVAATIAFAIILTPLLWKRQSSNTGKLPNELIVIKPTNEPKANDITAKPDLQKTVVRHEQVSNSLQPDKKNKQIPVRSSNQFPSKINKDTSVYVINEDQLSPKSYPGLNAHKDSAIEKKSVPIVHINNINATQPEPEFDSKKLWRFMRRYDIDLIHTSPPTGSSNTGSNIKNIN